MGEIDEMDDYARAQKLLLSMPPATGLCIQCLDPVPPGMHFCSGKCLLAWREGQQDMADRYDPE
jgi:hypothetical protein